MPERASGRTAAPRSAPRVVALGGGHGLAVTLRAVRTYAGRVTAVVSVADDGGSSGRLRRALDVPAPGDVRRCLVALADDPAWASAFEHRFDGGELAGHALGNLVLAGLAETLGDFAAAVDEAGRVLRAVGRVVPATRDPVALKADVEGASVVGQVAVARSPGRIQRVAIVPPDTPANPDAIAAIAQADQIVLAPGSLFTSLLAVVCVPGIGEALRAGAGRVVQVLNLAAQIPETEGLDALAHLDAVLDHGARVDVLLAHRDGALPLDVDGVRDRGAFPVIADLAAGDGAHDPVRLASSLVALL